MTQIDRVPKSLSLPGRRQRPQRASSIKQVLLKSNRISKSHRLEHLMEITKANNEQTLTSPHNRRWRITLARKRRWKIWKRYRRQHLLLRLLLQGQNKNDDEVKIEVRE